MTLNIYIPEWGLYYSCNDFPSIKGRYPENDPPPNEDDINDSLHDKGGADDDEEANWTNGDDYNENAEWRDKEGGDSIDGEGKPQRPWRFTSELRWY